jgi:hypothetical protein
MIHAIDVAISQLGIHEATGKNDGIPAERYMHGDKFAWCAGFALYCNSNSDDENVAPTTKLHYEMRLVKRFVEVMRERGLMLHDDAFPKRNDFVFFGDTTSDVGVRGNHMGIVEDFDFKTGKITTIEGNFGNKVSRVVHGISDKTIIGYARPVVHGTT